MVAEDFNLKKVNDEFVVVLEGDDFNDVTHLLNMMNAKMDELKSDNIPVWDRISVAAGLGIYNRDSDECLADVLNRADEAMYIKKVEMKK